jgi:hypothetical protein
MDDDANRGDPWASDDESWRGNEPQDSSGPGWQSPRSLSEVRERWASDSALRVIVGIAAVLVLFCLLAGLGVMWR